MIERTSDSDTFYVIIADCGCKKDFSFHWDELTAQLYSHS